MEYLSWLNWILIDNLSFFLILAENDCYLKLELKIFQKVIIGALG